MTDQRAVDSRDEERVGLEDSDPRNLLAYAVTLWSMHIVTVSVENIQHKS